LGSIRVGLKKFAVNDHFAKDAELWLMRTLAELNGIHEPKIYLIQIWVWNWAYHNWCEPRDHVVTQPTIKIEIWSRKAEIGLIGVWHNGNLPQGTNTIGLSRMTPRSQLIFDKSDSVRSRTEECKNHPHTLKLKNSEVIIIKAAKILAYMSLNSSWKINPNGPPMWTYMRSTQNWPKTLNWKAHNLIQTSLGS